MSHKAIPLLVALFAAACLRGQAALLNSQVYVWEQSPTVESANSSVRRICRGSGADLELLEVTATTLAAGQAAVGATSDACERILIVKSGKLSVSLVAQSRTLGTGSVAMVMPGEACRLAAAEDPVTYYQLRYKSRYPVDLARGQKTGGSKLIEWADLPYTANEVGGRRQPFERATAMLSESEMHVTTLNPGLTTHAPHTHVPEELILMIRGEAEMLIDGKPHRGAAGDLFMVRSMVPHNIHNVGSEPAEYYAFQWR
jgi:(S)-ureidoglycine aminohydrolase